MDIAAFLQQHRLPEAYADAAQKWFIPAAKNLHSHYKGAKRPMIVGINGCQGSGKSTLGAFIEAYLTENHQLNVVSLSLDDFYLASTDRQSLAVKVHPLLATRGVPGTHNMQLALSTLDRLSNYGTVSLPRFDKANDNPMSVGDWPVVNSPCDIIILEGWCVGAPPQPDTALQTPVNDLEQEQDPLGIWRKFVNTQLAGKYQTLFERIDHMLMLKAPSFEQVFTWRCEQEHKLAERIRAQGGAATAIMSDDDIWNFIQLYQRLTEHCLACLPALSDQVLHLDNQRTVTALDQA
ncbi:kinase [Alteromonas halophila]|uniref:Kinase n=1 Tax=Alteromonas halophila TaxID=516698 RepID=A0A918N022_9ALTE|nr:kinase [Alteromonas halophila]GGW95786.1 kinase [Alteromonas halophila]